MRKKSHIALAGYLLRQYGGTEMLRHRKAFYLGSILPDLNPGMVAAPHEYETSYQGLQQSIRALTDECSDQYHMRVFWRKLGIVLHYLADYFTFPHNVTYEGSLKDHCVYEGDMKNLLREYVQSAEAEGVYLSQKYRTKHFQNVEELFAHIEESHRRYMEEAHSVESDCRWIVELCSCVLISVIRLTVQNSGNPMLHPGVQVA